MRRIDGYEVIVVGGGPGGFAAAVAAARDGAKTLLVEREGCLGGGATTMLVHPFMPHTTALAKDKPLAVVNAGIFKEITDRLVAHGGGAEYHLVIFDDEILKVVLDEIAAEARVDVLFHMALFDVQVSADRVVSARFAHNGGSVQIPGKVFVDGTGDGLLAAEAGAAFEAGDEAGVLMPMTLNFILGGVDTDNLTPYSVVKAAMAHGDEDTPPLINKDLSCWSTFRKGYLHFNSLHVPGSGLDPASLSHAEAEARRQVENMAAWLRAKFPCFANCHVVKTGAHIGVRETRRILGDYVLTFDDFQARRKFDDGIACNAYGVDIHGKKPGVGLSMAALEYMQIPYRCLTPRGLDNVLMASRSISADYEAHGSLRVMPVVMNIGQAAGYAAAMSLPAGDVRAIDVQRLRQRIRQTGGVLEPVPVMADSILHRDAWGAMIRRW